MTKKGTVLLFITTAILLGLFASSFDIHVAVKGVPKTSSCLIEENELFLLLNKYRKEKELSFFVFDCELNREAQERAKFLFEHNQWNHDGFVESFQKSTAYSLGQREISYAEILARGFNSKEEVMLGWLGSKDHRRAILNEKYKFVGIGSYGNFVVAWFVN